MSTKQSIFPWLIDYILSGVEVRSSFELQDAAMQSLMEGRGQQQTLSLHWNIAQHASGKSTPLLSLVDASTSSITKLEYSLEWYDVLLVFELPLGVYVDGYELQHRYHFTWPYIHVYSYHDYIPYEDIHYWRSNPEVKGNLVAVELQQMPCKRSANRHFSASNASKDIYCELEHSLQLPIHLQYYEAQSRGGYVLQNLSFPQIFLRPRVFAKDDLPSSSSLYTFTSTSSRHVQHFYQRTLSGQEGNLHTQQGKYHWEVSTSSQAKVSLRVPVGNLDHHPYVSGFNTIISSCSTLILMYFILKYW